jgi:hypothetical protein
MVTQLSVELIRRSIMSQKVNINVKRAFQIICLICLLDSSIIKLYLDYLTAILMSSQEVTREG